VAPDAALPDGGRLRDRIGRGWLVVAERPVATPLPVAVVGAGSRYGGARAWLVRPDGYLADSAPLDAASTLTVPG
jgi:hypothetical protein